MISRQHMYNVGIYNIRLYEYFCLVSQRVQMHFYIFRQCTYIVFILQYQNTQKTCQTLRKKTRYKVVLIVFNGVPCDVNFYTVTVSYRCTVRITYQKQTIDWFMMTIFMCSKNWSSQCNLTARIEQGQDNCFTMVPSVLIARNK